MSAVLGPVGAWVGGMLRRKGVRRGMAVVLVILLVGGGTWGYAQARPVKVPRVLQDDLEDALNFMLISDEFNKLSLKERRDLLRDLLARMKGMDSQDSALMAAFAAGIMGPARAQLQKNAEKLIIDQWDDFAQKYTKVSKDKRGEFMDGALVEMTKMLEEIGGFSLPVKPEDRAAQAKKDAQRDKAKYGNRVNTMREDMAMGAAGMVQRSGEVASPKQKARMSLLVRDMTRHLRGEDIDTGKKAEPVETEEEKKKREELERKKKLEEENGGSGGAGGDGAGGGGGG